MKASNYYTSAQIQVADEAEGQAIMAHIADAVGHDTPNQTKALDKSAKTNILSLEG